MPDKITSVKKNSIRFHEHRAEWLKETARQCEKYGDTIETEIDGLNFYLKVTCPHQEQLDKVPPKA